MSHSPTPKQGQSPSISYPSSPGQTQPEFDQSKEIDPFGQYELPKPLLNDQKGLPKSDLNPGTRQCSPPSQDLPPGDEPSFLSGQDPSLGSSDVEVCEQRSNKNANQPIKRITGNWMSMPPVPANCPSGLEYLYYLFNFTVRRNVEFLEEIPEHATKNKFTIKNEFEDIIYWAIEESDTSTQLFGKRLRSFEIKVMDSYKNEIIHLSRPLKCASCCFPCCLQKVQVFSPPDNFIGSVQQNWSLFFPQFSLKDNTGNTVVIIKGPFYPITWCGHIEFTILSKDGKTKVGKISKQWSSWVREYNKEYFTVSFPILLDVRMKAVMIGAIFLIHAMFYEKNNLEE